MCLGLAGGFWVTPLIPAPQFPFLVLALLSFLGFIPAHGIASGLYQTMTA